jgi:hypothetical protein
MRKKVLLFCIAAGVAACVGMDDDVLFGTDAGTDAGTDLDVSGAALDGAEPSPPDSALEYLVVGLIFVGVGGSLRSRRPPDAKEYEI